MRNTAVIPLGGPRPAEPFRGGLRVRSVVRQFHEAAKGRKAPQEEHRAHSEAHSGPGRQNQERLLL